MIAPPSDQHPPASRTPAWHAHPDSPTIECYWDGERWTGENRVVDGSHPTQAAPATPQAVSDASSVAATGDDAYGPMPAARPDQEPAGTVQPTSGKAIAARNLGITSLILVVVVGPFAVVVSIAALVLGIKARREIARDPSIPDNGFARAGLIMGIVGIVLCVLMAIVVAVLLLGGGDAGITSL